MNKPSSKIKIKCKYHNVINLTYGKDYDVFGIYIRNNGCCFKVINDSGALSDYKSTMFESALKVLDGVVIEINENSLWQDCNIQGFVNGFKI